MEVRLDLTKLRAEGVRPPTEAVGGVWVAAAAYQRAISRLFSPDTFALSGICTLQEERRINPDDGEAWTFFELKAWNEAYYNRDQVVQFWRETCQPIEEATAACEECDCRRCRFQHLHDWVA